MLITIEELKRQLCILPDDTDDDALLGMYCKATLQAIERSIKRRIVQSSPQEDDLLLDDSNRESLKIAALMLASHWFNHREAYTESKLSQVPHAFSYLIDPFRKEVIG